MRLWPLSIACECIYKPLGQGAIKKNYLRPGINNTFCPPFGRSFESDKLNFNPICIHTRLSIYRQDHSLNKQTYAISQVPGAVKQMTNLNHTQSLIWFTDPGENRVNRSHMKEKRGSSLTRQPDLGKRSTIEWLSQADMYCWGTKGRQWWWIKRKKHDTLRSGEGVIINPPTQINVNNVCNTSGHWKFLPRIPV